MNQTFLKRIFAYVLAFCCAFSLFVLVGCDDVTPDTDNKDDKKVDVCIFMGQSNMAGRGEAQDSVVVGEGHGYEFRAVSDPSKLYPVQEPFGATENNEALQDVGQNGDGKKSGSLISAFVEGYYEQTKTPLVCVSASVGATSVMQWQPQGSPYADTNFAYFDEAKRRLIAAIDYLTANEYKVNRVFMAWCQGEKDANKYVNDGFEYFAAVQLMVDGLADLGNNYGVSNCFVITHSEYANNAINANKQTLANDMIAYCGQTTNNCVLVSVKFRNVPLNMRDDPHFHQGIYNVAGYDAGVNTAKYFASGKYPECKPFELGEDVTLADKFDISLAYTSN